MLEKINNKSGVPPGRAITLESIDRVPDPDMQNNASHDQVVIGTATSLPLYAIKSPLQIPGFDLVIGETVLDRLDERDNIIPVNLFVAKKADKPDRFYIVDSLGKEIGKPWENIAFRY